MANNNLKVWCLLISLADHKPTFGEPFPVSIRPTDTVHDLKKKITEGPGYDSNKFPDISPNELEIWMRNCKSNSRKLSANDSFTRTKQYLGDVRFDDNEFRYSDVEHLSVARLLVELPLEPCELLLVLVP